MLVSFSSSPRELLLLENQYSGTLNRVIILLSQIENFSFFPIILPPLHKEHYSIIQTRKFPYYPFSVIPLHCPSILCNQNGGDSIGVS